MDIIVEKEYLLLPVVPSAVRGKHIILLPCIRTVTECSKIPIGLILKQICLDKDRVRKHIDMIPESETLRLGIICSVLTLDYLAILIPHRASMLEDGKGVLRIIIQMSGP